MNDKFFKSNQKLLLGLVNTEAGRYLIGINKNDQAVKITPNSVHILRDFVDNKPLIEGKFYGYERMAKILMPLLTKMDIINNFSYKSLLHHSGLYLNPKYPSIFLLAQDFYAGAGDGVTANDDVSTSWATTHDAATGNAAGAGSATTNRFLGSYLISGDSKYAIYRAYYPTDTSAIGSAGTITAATLSVYSDPGDGTTNPDGVVVATSQASTSTLATSDYSLIGSTAFSDVITASGTSYKIWTLNATGRSNITKAGTTKMGLRNSTYDNSNSAPAINGVWATGNFSEQTGTSKDPYYSITYTASSGFFAVL
jgi:hypothetical protein